MKKRILLALLVSVVIFGAFYASAANLDVNGGVIQAGVDTDLVCDPDGVQVTNWVYETVDQLVYSVVIDGFHADCAGSEVIVGLHDELGNDVDSFVATAPAGGGSLSIGLGGIPAEDIYQLSVGIATSPPSP